MSTPTPEADGIRDAHGNVEDLDALATEARLGDSEGFDQLSALEAVELMQREDEFAVRAVAEASSDIARVAEVAAECLRRGGRLIYVGAGTSGRLGALDAAECPPTFGVDPDRVVAVLAGGKEAFHTAVEGAEDDRAAGAGAMEELGVAPDDLVLGIAASGRTPFVLAALGTARTRGARTAFLACVPKDQVPDPSELSIRILPGPEVLAGSTRLKAGTVTKLALNRITTVAMSLLGKVHGNRMVDVIARGNHKLTRRALTMVCELGAVEDARARALLDASGGSVKVAVLCARLDCTVEAARAKLERHRGHLRPALGSEASTDG